MVAMYRRIAAVGAAALAAIAWLGAPEGAADNAEVRAEDKEAAAPLVAPNPAIGIFDGAWVLRIRKTNSLNAETHRVQVKDGKFTVRTKNNRWRIVLVGEIIGRTLFIHADAIRGSHPVIIKSDTGFDGSRFAITGARVGQNRGRLSLVFDLKPDPDAKPAQPALAQSPRTDFGPQKQPVARPLARPVPVPQQALQRPPQATGGPDDRPPRLVAPNALETDRPTASITGQVSDPSGVETVTVDGRSISVGADGWFSAAPSVPEGDSLITIVATDKAGNEARHFVMVTRTPGQSPPTQQAQQPREVISPSQVDRDDKPPELKLAEQITTSEGVVEIAGQAVDASTLVEIQVAGSPVFFEENGSFVVRRGVPPGESEITVAALDEWGNRSEARIRVIREAKRRAAELDIDFGRYYALVIGNNAYQNLPRLETAVKDAEEVARVLEQTYGHEVTLLRDADRYAIMRAISDLRRKLTDQDNLLIYYAGHGVVDEEAEAGFWLPVDAEPDSEANWVANAFLSRNLKAMRAKHVLVVADSCYSGTLVREASTTLHSGLERAALLERMAVKRARVAMTSGGLEPVLDGGGGGHSVFAKAFLDVLRGNQDVLEARTVFDRLRRPVIVNSAQTPDYADIRNAGHDGGEFLFVRR